MVGIPGRTFFTPAPLPALPIAMETLPSTARSTADAASTNEEQPQQQARSHGRNGSATTMMPDERDQEEDADDEDDMDAFAGGYTPYLGRLTAVACLGGLQFGWDTGIASGMLIAIHEDLGHPLTSGEQEIIVSATTLGAILGALMAGRLSDWVGRKRTMVGAGILFAIGSIEQSASQVVRELVLGRLLVGLGVGMASMVVPTYLAECAPPSIRGRIIAINSLLITGGQVVAYVIDALFYNLPHGWRWMVLAGGAPALVQLVGLFYLDESPRWLISRSRHVEARHVLSRIYPLASSAAIERHIAKVEASLGHGQHGNLPLHSDSTSTHALHQANDFKAQWKMLFSQKANRRALLLACGLQFCQQAIGANSILYYAGRLLLMAGYANPNAAAVWVAVANFIGTAIALRLVDRMGRRTLLLRATAAATVALACLAIALGQIDMHGVMDPTPSTSITVAHGGGAWPILSLMAMVAFLFCYALGIGIVPWLVQSEIFSGTVRGVGGGLATATNWTMNLVTAATFLDLVRLITPQGCFWLYAVVGLATWTFAYLCLPELSGVSIDDVQSALEGNLFSAARSDQSQTASYTPLHHDEERDVHEDREHGTAAKGLSSQPEN